MPYCKSFDHTIPRFILNLDPFSPTTIKKNSNNLHAQTQPRLDKQYMIQRMGRTKHFTPMTDSYPLFLSWRRCLSYRNQSIDWTVFCMIETSITKELKLDGEVLPSWFGIYPKHLIMKILILMFFMARLGHIVGECLLMTCLGHVFGLKSKWKSNWNYMQTTWKLKLSEEEKKLIWKSLSN